MLLYDLGCDALAWFSAYNWQLSPPVASLRLPKGAMAGTRKEASRSDVPQPFLTRLIEDKRCDGGENLSTK